MSELRQLRIFVSSPGDVAYERRITQRVLEKLADQYARVVRVEPFFWEHEPLVATATFQASIIPPSKTDIVVCILWARLGTRLPEQFRRPDGTQYQSGTEFEFEDAMHEFERSGVPDLLVYRKRAEPLVSLKDEKQLLERLQQKKALDDFVQKWFYGKDGTIVAAYHSFEEPEAFEQLLEMHVRKLIERRLANWGISLNESVALAKPTWTKGSPFRGLDVFEFEHAPVFCGRTRATDEVLTVLKKQAQAGQAFVLVLGMSGCGKSSLVRAGVLPTLTEPGMIEGVGAWRRAIMQPGGSSGDLFDVLANALASASALPELIGDGTSVEQIAKMLRSSPEGAFMLVKGALSQAASSVKAVAEAKQQPEVRLVLFIDQLEELFTDRRHTSESRNGFFKAINSLATSGKVWVIATLRSDFYHRCREIPNLVVLKAGEGQYDLLPPKPAEIGRMIREPAQRAGLEFDIDPASGQSLDDILQNDATQLSEGLPLLEFALDELYRKAVSADGSSSDGEYKQLQLKSADYQSLGGLVGSLSQRAEQTFQQLPVESQKVFAQVFRKLVIFGQGDEIPTRRVASQSDFKLDPAQEKFVEQFVAARLFVADRTRADDLLGTVRIAHEVLLSPSLDESSQWPRLRSWLDQDRENLLIHSRIAATAQRWDRAGRNSDLLLAGGKPLDEADQLLTAGFELNDLERAFVSRSKSQNQRRKLMKQFAVGALVFLTITAIVSALMARKSQREAVAAKLEEQSQREHAQEQKKVAIVQQKKAEESEKEARNQENIAKEQEKIAKEQAQLAKTRLYVANLREAQKLWTAEDYDSARSRLLTIDPAIRGWEFYYLNGQFNKSLQTLFAHSKDVTSVAISPDEKLIASGSADKYIALYNVDTGKVLQLLKGHTSAVECIAISPDSKLLASGGFDQVIKIWDLVTYREVRTLKIKGETAKPPNVPVYLGMDTVRDVAFSPDGTALACASRDHIARIWEVSSGRELITFKGHASPVNCVAFSPNGKLIASGDDDGNVKLWDASSGNEIRNIALIGRVGRVNCLAFNSKGNEILAGNSNGKLSRVSTESGVELGSIDAHRSEVNCIAFGPKDEWIVSCGSDKKVKIWDAILKNELAALNEHNSIVEGVAVSSSGKKIVSGSSDKTLKVWSGESRNKPRSLLLDEKLLHSMELSRDGKSIISGHSNHVEKITEIETGKTLLRKRYKEFLTAGLAIGPDNKAARAIDGKAIRIWDLRTGEDLSTIEGLESTAYDLCYTSDGRNLLSGGTETYVSVWDVQSKKRIETLKGHTQRVTSIVLSPDGRRIATGAEDALVKIWDATSWQETRSLKSHSRNISTVIFSPDGKWIACAGPKDLDEQFFTACIDIWDAEQGKLLHTLRTNDVGIDAIAFSSDGKRIASSGSKNLVRIWDVETGEELIAIPTETEVVRLSFTKDDHQLIGGSRGQYRGGTAIFWTINKNVIGATNEPGR